MPSYTPIHFIGEQITVSFDQAPRLSKTPGCPNAISWQDKHYRILELLNAWDDYRRRGKMADNMRPGHLETASRRGSWGVGRFYFRVRTDTDQIFDLYYDRAPKDVDDRLGSWFLYRELTEDDTPTHRS